MNDVKEKVNASINEKTKDIQPLLGLNTTTLKYAVTWEGMAEHQPLMNEIDKILEGNQEVKLQQEKISQLTASLSDVDINADRLFNEYNDNRKRIEQNLDSLKKEYNRLRNLPSNQAYKRENWDRRMSLNMQIWNTRVPQSLNKDQVVSLKKAEIEKGIINAESQISSIKNGVSRQARENLIESVEEAKTQYDQIVAEESKDLTELKNKISDALKEVPTFESDAELLVDYDPAMLRAKLVDMTNFGNTDEEWALESARRELAEIGVEYEGLSGPMYEASNIKTAAIVRSRKYSYVDNYEYINARYNDPLSLNSEKQELEGEIKGVLGESNVVLDALNEKVETLSTELDLTKQQSQNLTAEISKLENEISSLKLLKTNSKSNK